MQALSKNGRSRDIDAGITFKDSVHALGRKAISSAVQYLFQLNSIAGIERAAPILTTLLTIGRAGECSYATYDQQEWNSIQEILDGNWNEKKVRKQSPMCFHHDYNDYRLDWYFVMFCYSLLGGGYQHTNSPDFIASCVKRKINPKKQSLIFPSLINDSATKVSNYLKDLVKCKVPFFIWLSKS